MKATRTLWLSTASEDFKIETNVVFDRNYNSHVFHHAPEVRKRHYCNRLTYFIASDTVKNFSGKWSLFMLR